MGPDRIRVEEIVVRPLAGEDEQATVRLRSSEELSADRLVDRTSVEDVRIDGINEQTLRRMVRQAVQRLFPPPLPSARQSSRAHP